MSRRRFNILCAKLTFDDIKSREIRSVGNKMFKIDEIFKIFRNNIRNGFEPNDNLCIDETLYPFRGILN